MRFGIIGCGLIGSKRAQAISQPHTITCVADIDKNRAQMLANKYNTKASTDWQEIINADVDAIIIATTHDQLATMALAAVLANKHVFVEKPAGRNAEEIIPIVIAAEKHKRYVKVGFNHRFHPAFLQAHEIVRSGQIGSLLYIRAHYGHGGRIAYEKEWRCQQAISGGGELIDQGPHLIDLSRWFLGELNLSFAYTPTYFWNTTVDDNCFLALQSATGQMAWLHASWTEWKNKFSFEIFGQHGKLLVDGLGGSYGVETLTLYRMLPEMGPPETTTWQFPFPDKSWEHEMREFINAIEEQRQPLGNIYDAAQTLKIIDGAYRRKYDYCT